MTVAFKQTGLLIAVAAAALAGGVLLYAEGRNQDPEAVASAAAAPDLMTARLPDLEGQPRTLEQWRGKILVVNFWATWCAPCREEIPAFIKIQDRYAAKGLQVVGIAIDNKAKVGPYAKEMKINYPILIGDLEAIELARQAGNRMGGLPYTVLIDRQGKPIHNQLGGIDEARLEALVRPLL